MDRPFHKWIVHMQTPSGEVFQQPIEAYWDPDYDGIEESVKQAAFVETSRNNKPAQPLRVENVS